MAFIVEDGTIVPLANAYIPVAYADAYFVDRGITAWASLSNDAKQYAIVNATSYIEMRYGTRFIGSPVDTENQYLFFPRLYYGATEGLIPENLKKATSEFALRASAGPLAPDIVMDDANRLYSRKVEEVGPIKEETSFAGAAAQPFLWRSYAVPEALLSTLLRNSSGRVIRN